MDGSDEISSFPRTGLLRLQEAPPNPLVYKALVTLKAMRLDVDGEKFQLSAGMQSSAEILLGTRMMAEYLLSPVRKTWHGVGRER